MYLIERQAAKLYRQAMTATMKQKTILLILSLWTISCKSQTTTDLVVEQINPIEYVFHFPFDAVKSAIIKKLDDYKFQSTIGKEKFDLDKGKIVLYESLHADTLGKDMWPDAEKILSKPEYTKDVYLYTFGYAPSQVYFSGNCKVPLIFSANYHLHLDKIDKNTTKVTVTTINHRVMTGHELLPTPQMCGFGRSAIFKIVPTTTVEQYELLLQIGNTLGEQNMPKIIIPTKICLTRTGEVKM
jgi:hypothetical protein